MMIRWLYYRVIMVFQLKVCEMNVPLFECINFQNCFHENSCQLTKVLCMNMEVGITTLCDTLVSLEVIIKCFPMISW